MMSKARKGSQSGQDTLTADRIIGRNEVGTFLNRSTRTVDRMAAQGIIRRIMFRGRQRSSGYSLSEIQRLMTSGRKGGAV